MARSAGKRSGAPVAHGAAAVAQKLDKARSLFARRQYSHSAEICAGMLRLNPRQADAHHLLALNRIHLGELSEALDSVRKALEIHPQHPTYLNTCGDILARLGRIDEAIGVLQASAAAQEDYLDPRCNLIRLYTGQGRYDDANGMLSPLLQRYADNAELHNLAGIVMAETGQTESAIEQYRRAIELDGSRAAFYSNLGAGLIRLGRGAEAQSMFETAIRIDPAYAHAWNNLALNHVAGHHWTKALDCFARYSDLVPSDPAAYLYMGQIFRMRSEHDLAVEAFERSLALGGDRSQLLTSFAYVLFDLGQVDLAVEHLVDALHLNARNWDAVDAVAFILLQSGKYQEVMQFVVDFEINPSIPYGKRARLIVARAIAAFHLQGFEQCKADLELADNLFRHESNQYDGNILELMIYQRYLGRLMAGRSLHQQSLDERPLLHVVGESHCLSPAWETVRAGSTVVVPHLVRGAKAWHLGQPKINQYQRNFVEVCARFPAGTEIMFCFGEIDCRLNEGFIPRAERHPDEDLEFNVVETVARYIDFVRHACAGSDWRIFIQGVPAPCPQTAVEQSQLAVQSRVIQLFNLALRRRTEQAGYGFVDVYAQTLGENGLSNGKWHLDDFHLRPDYIHQHF